MHNGADPRAGRGEYHAVIAVCSGKRMEEIYAHEKHVHQYRQKPVNLEAGAIAVPHKENAEQCEKNRAQKPQSQYVANQNALKEVIAHPVGVSNINMPQVSCD